MDGPTTGARWRAGHLAGWLLTAVVLAYATWFFGFATAHDGPIATLPVRILAADAPIDERATMIDRLRAQPARLANRTGLDRPTTWMMVEIPPAPPGAERTIQLSEKNVARGDAILLDRNQEPLLIAAFGIALEPSGSRRALPGYAIDLPAHRPGPTGIEEPALAGEPLPAGRLTLLVRIEPSGATQSLAAQLWDRREFGEAQSGSQQRLNTLTGALMLLAVYAITAALAGRVWYLLVFAFWLVARCGFVIGSAGFDYFSFGTAAGGAVGLGLRQLAMLSFPCAGALLVWTLMQDELRGTLARRLLHGVTVASCWATAAVAFLPVPGFQATLWVVSGLVILSILLVVLTGLRRPASTATPWYLAGLLLDAAAASNELLAATGVYVSPLPWFNLQQVSLLSAMLTGMAVGTSVARERTRRIESQEEAISALGKYEAVYRTVPIGLISFGASDRVERFNDGFARLFGLPRPETTSELAALQARLDQVFPIALRNRIRAELDDVGECDFPYRVGADAQGRWLRILARGSLKSFEASVTDITEHKNVERRLTHAAEHDALTGALNRRGLSRRITRLEESATDVTTLSLGYIDLDRFKLLNDLFGHPAGDTVLQDVVRRLQSALGEHVAIARLGGDEFALLFGADAGETHEALAWRALTAIAGQPFQIPPKSFAVTASVGLFRLVPGLSHEELIAGADRACRDAKRKGRNQVVVQNDSSALMKRHMAELAVLARLRDTRAFGDLELAVQPILALNDSSRLGGEILLRHRAADGTLQSPAGLIEAAEQRGEMTNIDRWVLQQSLEWLERNAARFRRLDFLSLNLSANSLNDEFFKTFVIAAMRKHHAVAPMVVVEINESVAMQDVFVMEKFISALRETGARIALDDFGSGHSNFASLSDVGASYLKIDGQFVRSLTGQGSGNAIIRTITVLAHELGMECIAEWVEDAETLALLKKLGADYGQGHALSPPMPLAEFEVLCASGELRQTPAIRRALGLSVAATAADVQRQLERMAPLV